MARRSRSNLPRIRAQLPAAVAEAVALSAEQVRDLASQLAPKATGDLSKSGRVEPNGEALEMRVTFGNDLPDIRAVAQEYGTIDQPAQPYLTPALKAISVKKNVSAAIKALMKRNRI